MLLNLSFFRSQPDPLVDQMLSRLQIDRETLARLGDECEEVLARQACENCEHTQACKRWLRDTVMSTQAPSFCPNEDRFRRARDRRG